MARPVVALITAYNEESTIGGVIDAVKSASLVNRVQVVDDGSQDRTYQEASSRQDVRVIRLGKRIPVGKALLSHLAHLEEPDAIVFFCDADLLHLTPDLVDSIIRPVIEGTAGMSVGVKEKNCGRIVRFLTCDLLPRMDILLGGERAMFREIADSILNAPHSSGYGLVTVMNRFCRRHRIPVKVIYMEGCYHRIKTQKWKARDALVGFWRLYTQIARAQLVTAFCPWRIPKKRFDEIPELRG